VVVDDGAAGVNRVVRGRDIAPSTATQVMLQRLLGLPTPTYRHHFLLLESRGGGAERKLAKLHGSVGYRALRAHHRGDQLCRLLPEAAGLRAHAAACHPADLVSDFDWRRVSTHDKVAVWRDQLAIEAS